MRYPKANLEKVDRGVVPLALGQAEIYEWGPDGVLVVCCPFYFHVHGYPSDYWRFTNYALDMLLERYPHRISGRHGPERRPINVWAIAWREDAIPPTEEQFQKYQMLLNLYARERLARGRRIAYGIGRVLCGRRPFAPYLDRNRWNTEWTRPTE